MQLDAVVDVAVEALTDRLGRLAGDRTRQLYATLEVATGCD
ncbi:hypothetical protein [Ornithinimicrobium flavum]|nr:hypothetical protein [Ornithinimicrobium flavum]